jgi:predicted NBD/HSP70 family sugar kinase
MRVTRETKTLDFMLALGTSLREQCSAVVNLIAVSGSMSRSKIMDELGWSRSTTTRAVTTLLDERLLLEDLTHDGVGRGRPAALLRLNPTAGTIVGVDLGFTSVRVILAALDHRVIASDESKLAPSYGADEGFRAAREMVERLLRSTGTSWEKVIGAGFAVGAPIDSESNSVTLESLRQHWTGDLQAWASQYFPCPAFIGNDTRLACYAELLWGTGRDYDNFIYLKLHSGTGGCFVINRTIVAGAKGGAGEIGHMIVDPGGEICRCGGRGCLETKVGVPAMLRSLSPALGAQVTWEDVRGHLADGDAATLRAFADAYDAIGQASASLCNILNPQAVILGGALSRTSPDIAQTVGDITRRHALSINSDVRVEVGELGRNSAALGAVAYVLMQGIV